MVVAYLIALMIAAFFQKPITYFLEDINLEELLGQDTSPDNNFQ